MPFGGPILFLKGCWLFLEMSSAFLLLSDCLSHRKVRLMYFGHLFSLSGTSTWCRVKLFLEAGLCKQEPSFPLTFRFHSFQFPASEPLLAVPPSQGSIHQSTGSKLDLIFHNTPADVENRFHFLDSTLFLTNRAFCPLEVQWMTLHEIGVVARTCSMHFPWVIFMRTVASISATGISQKSWFVDSWVMPQPSGVMLLVLLGLACGGVCLFWF
ncbi:hypothetical protein Tco_0719718 [Tanacetum coccineum]